MRLLEKIAIWILRRRGFCMLPPGFRGLAIGAATAICDGYDNSKPSTFTVQLSPASQLVALNHSYISAQNGTLHTYIDMTGATAELDGHGASVDGVIGGSLPQR